MSEMVERVARAMVRSGCGHDRLWDELSAISKEHWRLQARAAISAMREPTEAMVEKVSFEMQRYQVESHVNGTFFIQDGYTDQVVHEREGLTAADEPHDIVDDMNARSAISAMIDAALADPKAGG